MVRKVDTFTKVILEGQTAIREEMVGLREDLNSHMERQHEMQNTVNERIGSIQVNMYN